MLDENYTDKSDDLVEALFLADGPEVKEDKATGSRRSYTTWRKVVEHEGQLWALTYHANEMHSYAAACEKVRAEQVTVTKYVAV